VEIYYKPLTAKNFHMMSAFRNIDLCSLAGDSTSFSSAVLKPVYSSIISYANAACPNILHKCPYASGEKFALNFTYKDENCSPSETRRSPTFQMGGFSWPDGEYKVNISYWDDSFNLIYYCRIKNGDKNAF
jgi:hypothetical protein